MRRFFANLFILIIAACIVFFAGWIQFRVKPGTCGVLVSKTSGVLKNPVLPGQFAWRWETLLPTNANLLIFSMDPYKSSQEYSGSLPSNEIYEKMLDNNVDFSYDIKMAIVLSMQPNEIVQQVADNKIKTQDDLNIVLENKAMILAKEIAEYILNSAKDKVITHPKALDSDTLKLLASKNKDFEDIVLHSVEFEAVKIPDFEMYENARLLYETYKNDLHEVLKEKLVAPMVQNIQIQQEQVPVQDQLQQEQVEVASESETSEVQHE